MKESTHRVSRAIVNSGFLRPNERVVINLAPAELPKQAASFDLPISLGILVADAQIQSDRLNEYAVVGELALEGNTRPTRGALSMAIAAARERDLRGIVIPRSSALEAAVVEDIEVILQVVIAPVVADQPKQVPLLAEMRQIRQCVCNEFLAAWILRFQCLSE